MGTYHVRAASGEDFQTVAQVNGAEFSPGDCVLFNRGETFSGTRLNLTQNGSQGSPVYYGAYGSGAKPIISYDHVSYPAIYGNTAGMHDIKIQNLDVRNTLYACVQVSPTSAQRIYIDSIDVPVCGNKPIYLVGIDTFEVTNCNITSGTTGGITIYGSVETPICNGTVSYNHLDGGGVVLNDGIGIHEDSSLNHCGDHFLISHNVIHGYLEQAIDHQCPGNYTTIEYNECYGNTLDGIISRNFNTIIRRNKCYSNGRYGIIIDGTTEHPAGDIQIHSNILYDNGDYDLPIIGITDGVEVYNNTILHKAGNDHPCLTFSMGDSLVGPVNVAVKNNIFAAADSTQNHLVSSSVNLATNNIVFDHNCYWRPDANTDRFLANGTHYTFATWQSTLGQDADGMFDDPHLTSGTDLTLTSESPCINVGDPTVGLGYDHRGWPIVGTIDIGAYEYGANAFAVGEHSGPRVGFTW